MTTAEFEDKLNHLPENVSATFDKPTHEVMGNKYLSGKIYAPGVTLIYHHAFDTTAISVASRSAHVTPDIIKQWIADWFEGATGDLQDNGQKFTNSYNPEDDPQRQQRSALDQMGQSINMAQGKAQTNEPLPGDAPLPDQTVPDDWKLTQHQHANRINGGDPNVDPQGQPIGQDSANEQPPEAPYAQTQQPVNDGYKQPDFDTNAPTANDDGDYKG